MALAPLPELREAAQDYRALDLLAYLQSVGPSSSAEVCKALGWSKSRFDSALSRARVHLCPVMGVVIPPPTPSDGWRYRVTTTWGECAEGVAFALAHIEARLRTIHREIQTLVQNEDRRSIPGRRANCVSKHLTNMLGSLDDISGGPRQATA